MDTLRSDFWLYRVCRKIVLKGVLLLLLSGFVWIRFVVFSPTFSQFGPLTWLAPILLGFAPCIGLMFWWNSFANSLIERVCAIQTPDALNAQIALLDCDEYAGIGIELHRKLLSSVVGELNAAPQSGFDEPTKQALIAQCIGLCHRPSFQGLVELEYCAQIFAVLPAWGLSGDRSRFSEIVKQRNQRKNAVEARHYVDRSPASLEYPACVGCR